VHCKQTQKPQSLCLDPNLPLPLPTFHTQVEDSSLSAVSELISPLSSTTSRYSCDDAALDCGSSGVELDNLSFSGGVELPVESAAAKVSSVELLMGLAGSEGFSGYTAVQVGSGCVLSGA